MPIETVAYRKDRFINIIMDKQRPVRHKKTVHLILIILKMNWDYFYVSSLSLSYI